MKRGVCIVIISLFLIGFSVFEGVFTKNVVNNMEKSANEIVLLLENGEQVKTKVDELNDYWKQKESMICLFINHKDMEEIGRSLKKAQAHLENEDKQSALIEMKSLVDEVSSFKHVSEFNIQNIF